MPRQSEAYWQETGDRESYPASVANRWVNQQGPLLLEHQNGELRSVSDLVGEFRQKSFLVLHPDPHRSVGSLLLGSLPDIVSRWQSNDYPLGRVNAFQVRTMADYAKLLMAVQILQSGNAYPAPDGQILRYSERDFQSAFGMPYHDVPWWKERNVRGLVLTLTDGHSSRENFDRKGRPVSRPGALASASYLEELQVEEQRRGKGRVVLATIGFGSGVVFVSAAACAQVQEMPTVTQFVPTRAPTATRTPEPSPTPLAGGPDDERAVNPISPWPSLADISVTRSDGGPFTFAADSWNVQAQLEAVNRYLARAGWTMVVTPDRLTSGKTVYIAPFQDKDQWSIQALTADGVMVPIRRDGAIMDRPDWATREVARYEELEHGLGPGFQTRFELVNGHWVAVVRSDEGERVGFFDIFKGEWVVDEFARAEELVELLEDHPNDVSTWPSEYQEYLHDPWRSAGQPVESRTDAFISESRRGLLAHLSKSDPLLLEVIMGKMRADGLLRAGGSSVLETIERMSAEELLWAVLIHNAETQQETVLTPNEIRNIMGDPDAVVVNWTEVVDGEYIKHGLWHEFAGEFHKGLLYQVTNFSYAMDVFGQSVTIPRYPSHLYMGGRLAGLVELPGDTGTGMLLAYKDQGGGWHLQIFHVVYRNEAVQFDESMELCVGAVYAPSDLGWSKMLCPETVVSTEFRRGISPHTARRMQESLTRDWLRWPGPPAKVVMGAFRYNHRTYQALSTVDTFHHPSSGIEIVRDLTMDSIPGSP